MGTSGILKQSDYFFPGTNQAMYIQNYANQQ